MPEDNKNCRQIANEYIERAIASDEHVFMFDASAYDDDNVVLDMECAGAYTLDDLIQYTRHINVILWPMSYHNLDSVSTTSFAMGDFTNIALGHEKDVRDLYVYFGKDGAYQEIVRAEPDKASLWRAESDIGNDERGMPVRELIDTILSAAEKYGNTVTIGFDGSMQATDEACFTAAEFKPVKNYAAAAIPRLERGLSSWRARMSQSYEPTNYEITYEYRGDPGKLVRGAAEMAEHTLLSSMMIMCEQIFYDGYARELAHFPELPFKNMELSCQGQPEPVGYGYVYGLIDAISERFLTTPTFYMELDEQGASNENGAGITGAADASAKGDASESVYYRRIMQTGGTEAFSLKNRAAKRFATFMPIEGELQKAFEECRTFVREAGDIIDIWETFVAKTQSGEGVSDTDDIHPILPYYHDLLVINEAEEEEIDFSVYDEIAYELGIDKALRAYFDGVPISDVTA